MRKMMYLLGIMIGCGGGSKPVVVTDLGSEDVWKMEEEQGLQEETWQEKWEEIWIEEETYEEDIQEEDAGIKPGAYLYPCKDNSECMSGYCVETPDGMKCSKICSDISGCEEGWECVQVAAYPDVTYACVHPAPRVCKPCKEVKDCEYKFSNAIMDCVNLGGGYWCLERCEGDYKCGVGTCNQIGEKWLCMPEGGECKCTEGVLKMGGKGKCYLENEYGKCEGEFSCIGIGEKGKCEGKEPKPEECNGQDDDCDGDTDEGVDGKPCELKNTYGVCIGKTTCLGGKEKCEGFYASPEVCNGIDDDCDGKTDEGYSDLDGDGIADCVDEDKDGDGVLDKNDNCPEEWNGGQEDNDKDGKGDVCDPDDDNDGVQDEFDNCVYIKNPDQKDLDKDGKGDECDEDIDGDGVVNEKDNCVNIPNKEQEDKDKDGKGDVCDEDIDGDGVENMKDNCIDVPNKGQEDNDKDGKGDVCDVDDDNDDVSDEKDNCPYMWNPNQLDNDGDGKGDACDEDRDGDGVINEDDNCPDLYNPDQKDENGNKIGDICEMDWDSDGILNSDDNCPWIPNNDQKDIDQDGLGDVCDCDIDGDGVLNLNVGCQKPQVVDNCPYVPNVTQGDMDSDGMGDVCDDDMDGDGDPNISDCGPMNPMIFHGAKEVCNGIDDDCDGGIDGTDSGGCIIYYYDSDKDGYGTLAKKCLCEPEGYFSSLKTGDCNDKDEKINPQAEEVCDGIDNNCNGQIDEEGAKGCEIYYKDADQDGYGSAVIGGKCLCGEDKQNYFTVQNAEDCNDIDPMIHPKGIEVCNMKDDDCDGETDEGVQSPCGGCSMQCVLAAGQGTNQPFTPNEENSSGVDKDKDGTLKLSSSKLEFPFIWIANSGEGTVSKLNTKTGCEMARYSVCSDPSRTAVDLNGNGIITCRGDGKVAKVSIFEQDCIDKNQNGKIDTSKDKNGDCKITQDEMVGGDECVLWIVQPDGASSGCSGSNGCARAAGVDKDNNIWVGFWNSKKLMKLKNENGTVLVQWTLSVRPYGLAIDKDQLIWVSSRDPCQIAKVSPISGQINTWSLPSGCPYGIAVDPYGKVWVAGWSDSKLHRFDPSTNTFLSFSMSPAAPRGLAVKIFKDQSGNVIGAHVYGGHNGYGDGSNRKIGVVDALNLMVLPYIDIGKAGGPVGVAIDSDGNLWTCNHSTSDATKVDLSKPTPTVVGHFPIGKNPYTYSDMTGYAAKSITAPSGYYREIFTGWSNATTTWTQLFVSADTPGAGKTYIKVRYRVADTLDALKNATWIGPAGPFPPQSFPLNLNQTGKYLEVEVGLYTDDPMLIPTLKGITVMATGK